MNKKIIVITVLIIGLLFTSFNVVKAEQKSVTLDFFYTTGCGTCEEKKPLIESVEQNYIDLKVTYHLVINDKKSDNYTLLKDLYGFKYVPAVVISKQDAKRYFCINYENITLENLEENIDRYHLDEENKNDSKINTKKVFLDFYYSNQNEESVDIKNNVIKKAESRFEKKDTIFFRYKEVENYSWEYKKYSKNYTISYPFLVVKTLAGYTILKENDMSVDKIKQVLDDLKSGNNTRGDDDNGFLLPGFEFFISFMVILFLTVFFKRKKYKK